MAETTNGGVSKWLILATVIIGTFLGRIDQTIVGLGLPKIMDEFSITVSQAGWISTAYILANAIFVPVWGKLGDTIGRKKVYILGFTIFIFGSVLAGLSWNLSSMIVFRVIQAIASSADYPTAMAIIAVTFPAGKARSQALGIWSSSFAAAAVFGPLVGGPLIDNFGWRSVFLVNLPVGILGLLMAWFFIHESQSEKKTVDFDWNGATVLGLALFCLVLVLDKGYEWGWTSGYSMASYGLTAIFFTLFYAIEKGHTDPIVNFAYLKKPIFLNVIFNNFIVFMGMIGGIILLPIFAQIFLGYDATLTGYLFMPMAAGMMIAAPLGGFLSDKVQPRYVIFASTAVAALGLHLFTLLDARSGPSDVVWPLLIMALGMGFGMAQRTSLVAAAVPENEVGSASAVLALARNIAGAFGVALFTSLLDSSVEKNVLDLSANSSINIHTPLAYQQTSQLIILKAQVLAYHTVFETAAIIVAIGAFLALTMKITKDASKEASKAEVFVE